MNTIHIINKRESLLSALKIINAMEQEPLVLFVVDDDDRMVGTLTDGDSRRALIAGVSVNDSIEKVMHKTSISFVVVLMMMYSIFMSRN